MGQSKSSRVRQRQESALLERLSATLSADELERVQAGALLELDAKGRQRLVERLGPDTGQTLKEALKPAKRRKPKAGKGKILEAWQRAWGDWDECISESAYEEGKYVLQDYDWEAPYFNAPGLSADLELIATRMRDLLGPVLKHDLDPELSFAEAIAGSAEESGSGLPEWMVWPDGCEFGPEVTRCLLEWEWTTARARNEDAFDLVDNICSLDLSLDGASLDPDAIAGFIFEQSDADQQAILAGISASAEERHWAQVLKRTHRGWFHIFQKLAKRWQTETYLQSCRDNIAKDWRLALPLLKGLIRKKAFDQARTMVGEAVGALLRLDPNESWDPREQLLVRRTGAWRGGSWSEPMTRLLKAWQKVAAGLGEEDLADVLQLQATVSAKWQDWSAVIDAFQRLQRPAVAGPCDRLFRDWVALVSGATLSSSALRFDDSGEQWLVALADAARAGGNGEAFHSSIRQWLKDISREPGALTVIRPSLATLTADLDARGKLKRTAPTFHSLAPKGDDRSGVLCTSRRRWVKQLGSAQLLTEVLEFWKKHAAALVPDPGRAAGSRYDPCAEWAAALGELDPQVAEQLIERWSEVHRRRRNLWKALRSRGLTTGR